MSATHRFTIIALSLIIPSAVAYIFYNPGLINIEGDISFMPRIHAYLNSGTAFCLMLGYTFIRLGKRNTHRAFMISALVISLTFFLSYVIYHSSAPPVKYQGGMPGVYFTILISHIILAAAVVPFVLFTVYRALTDNFEKHKKVARWTFPIWLYVAITGVLVYWMNAGSY